MRLLLEEKFGNDNPWHRKVEFRQGIDMNDAVVNSILLVLDK